MTKKRLNVFLSYSANDKSVAQELIERLELQGIDTWFEEHQLQPGTLWENNIRNAIAHSDYLVAILPKDKASQYLLFEIGLALGEKKTVIPVAIGESFDNSILGAISKFQIIKSDNASAAADQIARAIGIESDA